MDWMNNTLNYPLFFFEYINAPSTLRTSSMQKHVVCLGSRGLLLLKEVQKHVVCLGPRGLLLLKEVLDCLERAHCLGYLYDGSFQLQDFRCGMEKIHRSHTVTTLSKS